MAARRVALVTALTVGMLTVFATFGGIGYASSAAGHAIQLSKIERLVGISQHTQSSSVNGRSSNVDQTAADDEYKPGKGCGDSNHVHVGSGDCPK